MSINRITAKDFGPFAELDVQFSPGLNVILGDDGTGKTHLLKALYAATAITVGEDRSKGFERKLAGVFGLERRHLLQLIRQGRPSGGFCVERVDDVALGVALFAKGKALVDGEEAWQAENVVSAYIPSEDVLAHAPGFLSTVARREIAFDDTYSDILMQAYLPALKNPAFGGLLAKLEDTLGGKVIVEGERFYLKSGKTKLEFALVSEGVRRLALLWLLLKNGSIQPGSVLFWDLPESGLNHRLEHVVADVLAALSADGVQVIVTTNSLFLLREFEIEASSWHYAVRYINLQKTEAGVRAEQADSLAEVGLISTLEESLQQADRYMEV